jgi:PAS domain S-box-containing protein
MCRASVSGKTHGDALMTLMAGLNALRIRLQDLRDFGRRGARMRTQETMEEAVFPSTAPPGRDDHRLALVVVVLSLIVFITAVPFVRTPLPQIWAFIPIYESALVICDLVTAVLLFAQFWILRSRALVVLACGYVFAAAIVVAHALTFPGLFSAQGLLGSGNQSTAWLYMFWHAGFPLCVIAYALLKDESSGASPGWLAHHAIAAGIGVALAAASGLTALATVGHSLLPAMLDGNSFTTAMRWIVSVVWGLSFVALAVLWMRPRRTVIDLWLMVVMCAWIFDIALSAALNAARFDVGWYAGRVYGLLAATFVLLVLLVTTARLYGRLAWLLGTEQKARRRESGLRQRIFETSQDLILVCDRRGNFIQVSPSCRTILGYAPEEMIGREAKGFLFREDLDNTRNEMRAARQGQLTRTFNCRYVHKDHHIVPLAWTGVWSEIDQQHFFIGRDMSEHINLEHQLRQAQKMEAIGQLTGGIAHDFNNILAIIIGMAELTAVGVAADPKLSAMVKQIDEAADRGAQLVQRMLAFARKQPLECHILDVNETVERASAMLERTLGEDIALRAACGENLWPVIADPAQLGDAIVNLAVNARDAMPKGGRLLVETANVHLDEDYAAQHAGVRAGDYVAVIVADSGTGMSAEVMERVFEPFFTTKEVGRGTGLGLSMVYGFVKQSGGHVKIYSEVGHGTSVKMYFPKAERSGTPRVEAPVHPTADLPEGRGTILVVEDDLSVRKMAVGVLEDLGFQVRQACDGKVALDILHGTDHIDLLFTDMIMPNGVTGQDLVREAHRLRPGMKALLTSGYSEQFLTRTETDPDVPLLRKPYRRQKLASAIRSVLGNTV